MSRKYFGTDGVRGRVGEWPMTPEFALRLGWAAGKVLGTSAGARVVIGKDTRRSGYVFESAMEAGFAAAGVEVDLLGPLPTPGVAYLTRALRARAGVVISASHNPHADNGFKFFGPDGGKLSDDVETQIESLLDTPMQCVSPEQFGRVKRIDDAAGRYIEFCKSTFASRNLRGLRLVVDCANGAAYKVAPAVFEELDADVVVIASEPDGLNINAGCGSTHLGLLQQAVKKHGADVGIALDGDADRCLMVDAAGQAVDGDQILYVLARAAHEAGRLQGPVVGTLMSNLGLEQALQRLGLSLERVSVGDRYVLERLRQVGGTLGGEGSGHTICLDKTSTGDGIVTALQVLASMEQKGASLAALLEGMHLFPQTLVNVPVKGKASALLESAEIRQAVAEVERRLGSSGRVLLRASGTEPLVRVMVECDSAESARREANALADMVKGLIKS